MINFRKRSLLMLSTALILNPAVYAQQDSVQGGDDKLVIEDIVVTANKREQNLQDVSLAVSALTAERLADAVVSDAGGLSSLIPNFSIGADFGQAKIFIRGIGLNSSFAGVDPSVALHLDGAVISQSYAQLGAFFDLERVEVLRGPQGTLYGRNAIGGSVNLISKKPTEDFEAYTNVTLGNYQKLDVEGAVSGPLTENIQGRLAFKTNSHSGYGINEVSGSDIDNESRQSFRGQMNFKLSDSLNFLLSADYQSENDNSGQMHFIDTHRAFELRQYGIDDEANLPAGASIDGNTLTLASGETIGITRPAPGLGGHAKDPRNIASEIEPNNKKESYAFTGTLDWDINDEFALRSITNYRNLDVLYRQDIDQSSNVNDDIQNNTVTSEQFSEELQFIYNSDRLHGLVGLFYFDETLINDGNDIAHDFDDPDTPDKNERDFIYLFGDIGIKALGAFANFTYDISDTLSAKVGARYSDEKRTGKTFFRINGGNEDCLPGISQPAPEQINGFCDQERDFSDFSPTVGLDWRPTDDVLLYASYTEGFKSGAVSGGARTPITEPERSESYEIGVKSSLFENRVRLNLAAFKYTIDDLQQSRSAPDPVKLTFVNIFDNAARARGRGIELEADWLVTDQFKLDGYFSYLDSEFLEFSADNPVITGDRLDDLAGNKTKQSPEFSWNLHGQYDVPLDNDGTLSIGAEVSHKSEQFFTEFNDEVDREDAYTLVNANIKYTAPNGRFTVNAWVRNLTDEFVYTGRFVIGSVVTTGGTLLPPRTYGATLGYKF